MPRLFFSGAAASASQTSNSSRNELRNSMSDGASSTSTGGRPSYLRRLLSRQQINQPQEGAASYKLSSLPPVTLSSSPALRPRLSSREIIQQIQQQQQSAINFNRGNQTGSPGLSESPPLSDIIIHHEPGFSNASTSSKVCPQNEVHSVSWTPVKRRRRFNSRDIATTYAGQYGSAETDLLPFECMRIHTINPTIFLSAYVVTIVILHVIGAILDVLVVGVSTYVLSTVSDVFEINAILYERYPILDFVHNFWTNLRIDSWTITNAIHLLVTISYVHWAKGRNSFLFLLGGVSLDEQGEMNAMTLWEQLEAVPESVGIRRILLVIPTLLTYISCLSCSFQHETCYVNIIFWCISMLGKLPCMNGVRLFGINRTAGIDDDIIDYIETKSINTSSSNFNKRFKYI